MISKVVDYDSPPGNIARLIQKEAKSHTCFQVSMKCIQLYRILDLDAAASYYVVNEEGEVSEMSSMRQVIPKHCRTWVK